MCHPPISSISHLHSDENMTLISLTLDGTSAGLGWGDGQILRGGGGYQVNIGPGNIYTSTLHTVWTLRPWEVSAV